MVGVAVWSSERTGVYADPDGCQECGAVPAKVLKFSSLRGMLIIFQVRTHKGRWCRDCARAQFRSAQDFTLGWGWYSFFSFFLTPIALLLNLSERSKGQKLTLPTQRRAAALPEGEPLHRRPGLWIAGGVLFLMALLAVLGG